MAKLSVKCDEQDMRHWKNAAAYEGMTLDQWVSVVLDARMDAIREMHWWFPNGMIVRQNGWNDPE